MNFLYQLEAGYRKSHIFMAAILMADKRAVCANVNMNFYICNVKTFQKMCSIANLHTFLTKLHKKPDYKR